jgi:hypothetical protein
MLMRRIFAVPKRFGSTATATHTADKSNLKVGYIPFRLPATKALESLRKSVENDKISIVPRCIYLPFYLCKATTETGIKIHYEMKNATEKMVYTTAMKLRSRYDGALGQSAPFRRYAGYRCAASIFQPVLEKLDLTQFHVEPGMPSESTTTGHFDVDPAELDERVAQHRYFQDALTGKLHLFMFQY